VGAHLYDLVIHDTLAARGAQPAPGVEEHGRTVESAT
jgi:hypothetical protein